MQLKMTICFHGLDPHNKLFYFILLYVGGFYLFFFFFSSFLVFFFEIASLFILFMDVMNVLHWHLKKICYTLVLLI